MLNFLTNIKKRRIFLFFLLFLIFLIPNTLVLPKYSVNWDEPIHFGRGQAFLHYLTTGKKNYDDLPKSQRKSYYELEYYSFTALEKFFAQGYAQGGTFIIGGGHPPVSDVISSISNYVFYQKLGILGDVEAYHFYSLLLAGLLVGMVYLYTAEEYGDLAGVIAAVSLGLYPMFLGESHFNTKDVPEAFFYSVAILFFYKGITRDSLKYMILSCLSVALAFGTKLNIIFIPFILIPWFALYLKSFCKTRKDVLRKIKLFIPMVFSPILGALLIVAVWPILWPDPIRRFMTIFTYYKSIGTNQEFDPRFLTILGLNTYAIQWILYTTPIVILFFILFGIIYRVTHKDKKNNYFLTLVILWFTFPVLRVTMPGAGIYGGVRQIMEYVPALAIISGVGASFLLSLVSNKLSLKKRGKFMLGILIFAAFIPITIRVISLNPNESLFFNQIIGGLAGAKADNIPGWGDSLGSTYKQGVNWLNTHAEKNAKLVFGYETQANIPNYYLRPDIKLYNQYRSGLKRQGEYIITVTHDQTQQNLYFRKYAERFLIPLYQVKVDGVAVLKIWKNDLQHTKPDYKGNEQLVSNITQKKNPNEIILDLHSIVRLTKVKVTFTQKDCALSDDGYFEVSPDGQTWERIPGSLNFFSFAAWFKPEPQPGILQYLFAADEARYVGIVDTNPGSCLFTEPLTVSAWKI